MSKSRAGAATAAAANVDLLRHITFADVKFLKDFFALMPGSKSLAELASRLKMTSSANLHHRLERALKHFGVAADVYDANGLTPDGIELKARVDKIWRGASPYLPNRRRGRQITIQLAMPEVITGRSYFELLRRLHEHKWRDAIEVIPKRFSPARLAYAAESGSSGDDLILTLSSESTKHRGERKSRRRPVVGETARLRRVLLCLNNDSLVWRAWREGNPVDVDDESIRDRPLYLPPRQLLPGFCFERFDVLCDVHEMPSFADAHARTLAGRGAIAVAHPELIDEIEDKLCAVLTLGSTSGESLLTLHEPRRVSKRVGGERARIIAELYEVFAEHIRQLGQRSERADHLNALLSPFRYVSVTSDAEAEDSPAVSATGRSGWHWRRWRIEGFHMTPLGHLKGRFGPIASSGDFRFAFDLFGRVMREEVDGHRQYHALLRAVDDRTRPGDTEPRVEHVSVNLVFTEQDLQDHLLVGVWSGRRSGRGIWEPGCGVVVLTSDETNDDVLNRLQEQFREKLHNTIDHYRPDDRQT